MLNKVLKYFLEYFEVLVLAIKKFFGKKYYTISFRTPPRYRIEDIGKGKIYGVIWHFWIGCDLLSLPEERRIWVDGPFCPICSYELDHYYKYWKCLPCKRKFKIPKDLRDETESKIIKIFESELRKKGIIYEYI